MNQIQQTILTIDDIVEHHDSLLKLPHGYIDMQAGLIESYDMSPEAYDDMLMRFTRTFMILEDVT